MKINLQATRKQLEALVVIKQISEFLELNHFGIIENKTRKILCEFFILLKISEKHFLIQLYVSVVFYSLICLCSLVLQEKTFTSVLLSRKWKMTFIHVVTYLPNCFYFYKFWISIFIISVSCFHCNLMLTKLNNIDFRLSFRNK